MVMDFTTAYDAVALLVLSVAGAGSGIFIWNMDMRGDSFLSGLLIAVLMNVVVFSSYLAGALR